MFSDFAKMLTDFGGEIAKNTGIGEAWDNATRDLGKAGANAFLSASDLVKFSKGEMDYSDLVKNGNVRTDGWTSTLMDSAPFLNQFHNAMLGRDYAKDYMENNGLTWADIEPYNADKLLSRTNNSVNNVVNQGTRWLKNTANDLGKLYSEQGGN